MLVDAFLAKVGDVIVGNVVVCKKLTVCNRVHKVNAFEPILVIWPGIVMEVRAIQLLNVLAKIVVSPLFGKLMEVRPQQFLNAFEPIYVIVLGIVRVVKALHCWNVYELILVSVLGNETSVIFAQ